MTPRGAVPAGALLRALAPWAAGISPLAGGGGGPARVLGILFVVLGLAAICAGVVVRRGGNG